LDAVKNHGDRARRQNQHQAGAMKTYFTRQSHVSQWVSRNQNRVIPAKKLRLLSAETDLDGRSQEKRELFFNADSISFSSNDHLAGALPTFEEYVCSLVPSSSARMIHPM